MIKRIRTHQNVYERVPNSQRFINFLYQNDWDDTAWYVDQDMIDLKLVRYSDNCERIVMTVKFNRC